jgi:hypothetical protein
VVEIRGLWTLVVMLQCASIRRMSGLGKVCCREQGRVRSDFGVPELLICEAKPGASRQLLSGLTAHIGFQWVERAWVDRKARRTETASLMSEWLRSPCLRPPASTPHHATAQTH